MKRLALALILSIAVPAGTAPRAGEIPKPVASLVAAEKVFAAMSVEKGMRAAFLAYLADSALVLQPGPVPGREAYEKRKEGPAVLWWEPRLAEVSATGTFGYTTGPWEYRASRDADPQAFGHFVSVWETQTDGSWKVILDAGISHEREPSAWPLSARAGNGAGFPNRERSRRALLQTERAFADAASQNRSAAYADFSSDDVRLYREGAPPTAGKTAVCRLVGASGQDAAVSASGARVAASGDLGFTIGSVGAGPSSYFLRIWRREPSGEWRIVIDLDSPVPPGE
jgi:ketosteroid isomerase-like protein